MNAEDLKKLRVKVRCAEERQAKIHFLEVTLKFNDKSEYIEVVSRLKPEYPLQLKQCLYRMINELLKHERTELEKL